MANEYSYNAVVTNEGGEPEEHVYRTREQDRRPRCTLVLGNGFTQDFLATYGLRNELPCCVSDLFPASQKTPYIAVERDCFTDHDRKFWDPRKWPLLFDAWSSTPGLSAESFLELLARERVNPDVKAGLWTFRTRTISFELRCYLHHYFRAIWLGITRHRQSENFDVLAWHWCWLLTSLLHHFRLACVTFNYDQLLEQVLYEISEVNQGIGRPSILEIVPANRLNMQPADVTPIVKVHGGVGFSTGLHMEQIRGYRPNPWLHDDIFERNAASKTRSMHIRPDRFPTIPDIVPPGHQGDHICNPDSRVRELSQAMVADADVVIVCGLGGGGADEDEVQELLSARSAASRSICIGLRANGDTNKQVAQLLSAHPLTTNLFIDSTSEIKNVMPTLRDWFPLS